MVEEAIRMLSPLEGVDEDIAHKIAHDGFMRMLDMRGGGGRRRRGRRSGKVAGGHTRGPRVAVERCTEEEQDESEEDCDPTDMFRTIDGECNNLG